MPKKFIRRTGRYKRKPKGLKKVFRNAIKRYRNRIFKRRELAGKETKYITQGNNNWPMISVASTNDIGTDFHEVVFASTPPVGDGPGDREGNKFRALYSTYTFTYSNPVDKVTDFISGIMALVVVKEKVYRGTFNADNTQLKTSEIFINLQDPFFPNPINVLLGKYSVKVYKKQITTTTIGTTDLGMNDTNKNTYVHWTKKFKHNKNRVVHSNTVSWTQVPRIYVAMVYFGKPWTSIKGNPPPAHFYAVHSFKEV